ncbi:MAG TPA: SRPBCC domain-containing protein [Chthonomonadaceae bacterium]|nr:SRPBCC domain-containing protein [Chthonomonadaceae bacterium]
MKLQEAHNLMRTVSLERFYPHSPERVWQALTDPQALTQWLLPNTFKPLLGHRFRLIHRSPEGKRRKVRCQVVELEAPSRLAYTWQAEGEDVPTLVTWTLVPVEAGTCLRLEHIGLETSSAFESGVSIVNRLSSCLQTGGSGRRSGVRKRRTSPSARKSPFRMQVGRILLDITSPPLNCVTRSICIVPLQGTTKNGQEVSRCIR